MSDGCAQVQEIFSSIQGEGILAGTRQVFLRFQGCNLHCNYCDTPTTRGGSLQHCRVEQNPGFQDFANYSTPLSLQDTAAFIERLWTPSTKHLCLTGGEPLLQTSFIKQLAESIKHPIYLETNSTLPEAAASIAELIDTAACDIKLKEHQATHNYDDLLHNTLQTIQHFHNTSKVFLKIIVLQETTSTSLTPILEAVSDIDTHIPLVLQPSSHLKNAPHPRTLLQLMDAAARYLEDVRVIPQLHKMLKIP